LPYCGFFREEADIASGFGPAKWPLEHNPGSLLTLPCSDE
jgi:hypothetical protein